jgi:hypothetical protein
VRSLVVLNFQKGVHRFNARTFMILESKRDRFCFQPMIWKLWLLRYSVDISE